MTPPLSRRELLKLLGAAGAGGMLPLEGLGASPGDGPPGASPPAGARRAAPAARTPADGEITALVSTSDVFVPPRGEAFVKFSFDFPEPSVAFAGHRFGFMIFTAENAYGLDRARMRAQLEGDTLTLTCDGFVWAGGQEQAPERLTAAFRRSGDLIEWDAVAEMEQPIRTVTTIVRDVPRGRLALGGGRSFDPGDDEVLAGYPFGGGDLFGPGAARSIATALATVAAGEAAPLFLAASLDDRVRPKRFYFQPGDGGYRLELVHEHDAWREDRRVVVPRWRIGRAASAAAASALHARHLERAYALTPWESRDDVVAWMRDIALVVTLHGMHETGFVFNDFGRMLEILRWIAQRIDGHRVLVFLPAWDGRYYWSYPNYVVSERLGGETGLRRLIDDAHALGFKLMPMFGANAANRKQPVWPRIAGAVTTKIDGNPWYLDWVDWNNDRHQDGWAAYMNLGAPAWREWLESRIADAIERYGVDAYFLDIVGGHVNSTNGDMHEGTRLLVENLRRRYPRVLCVGEMPYDALLAFIPVYQAGGGPLWQKYSRFFSHLSTPAPGRGSSGVHESGFGRFDATSLELRPGTIPTLQVVDDTFARHRDVMAAVIERAQARAGGRAP